MRTVFALLSLASGLCFAQSESRTYVYDNEGRRTPWTASSSANGQSATTLQNLNGRSAPLEQVEERTLSDAGGTKTVERIIKRFASDGSPLPPERQVIETVNQGGGRTTTTTTIFRGDLNGRLAPAERAVAETVSRGDSGSSTTTTVARPSLNGSFENVERRETQTTSSGDSSRTDETVYRVDSNGRLAEAARKIERVEKQGNATITNLDEYEAASTGSMALSKQVVKTETALASGGVVTVTDVFGMAAPGRPSSGKMELRERQIAEKTVSANGSKETYSIQRPAVDGSGRLSAPRLVAETVCSGKCAPAAAPAAPAKP